MSRFVAAFETPAKVTLQLYRSLLRAHSTQEKDLIRASLDVLVPQLPKRLSPDEVQNVMKYTIKIFQEEGNTQPQVVHILECISRHPEVYRSNASVFTHQMLNALPMLGITQHSPTDLKELSLDAAKLIFEWSKTQASQDGTDDSPAPGKSFINQTILDTVVNFVVKIIFLNMEGKADILQRQLHTKATSLLKDILSDHPKLNLSEIYFDRVFASGLHTNKAALMPTPLEKKENAETDAIPMVIATLDILTILRECDAIEALIQLKTSNLVAKCFSCSFIKNVKIQTLLKDLITSLINADGTVLDSTVLIDLLEDSIVPVSTSVVDPEDANERAYLAIDVIERICSSHPSFIFHCCG